MSAPSLSTLADLTPQTLDRVQDPESVYWRTDFEIQSALVEAINEMMLIVGRPTAPVSAPITIQPNTPWQQLPLGMLGVTDLWLNGKRLGKVSLRTMDYTQTSWQSSWQGDRSDSPRRWGPLGLKYFFVHPSPVQPVQAVVTAVSAPVQTSWPFASTTTSPFHKEVDDALECYAAWYCRLKDSGDDWLEGKPLYEEFLKVCQRLTAIEDRRDALMWTQAFGPSYNVTQVTKR